MHRLSILEKLLKKLFHIAQLGIIYSYTTLGTKSRLFLLQHADPYLLSALID